MAIIRSRTPAKTRRIDDRNRAGLGGRANARKRVERALATEVIDETDYLAEPDKSGRPRDRKAGRTGGAHRAGKHVVEDGGLAEERGSIADPRVSGALVGKRSAAKRRTR